ncbi:MAG: ABC transporter permease [Pseudomonadota bacterium]
MALKAIVQRELMGYFGTPLAYVFLVIFLMITGVFTFFIGQFFERGQADLVAFFNFHPWLYLFLLPALSMRLWAEERKTGTIEFLMTLPVSLSDAVIGKFIAAWLFAGVALMCTFFMWVTVNYLGDPDNGVILASYLGSWLMAGAFLAIGSCLSATTSNQVIAFILTVVVCFLFVMAGFPMIMDWASVVFPQFFVDAIASLSFLTRFESISKGVLDVRDFFYFAIVIVAWLLATALIIEIKKGKAS